MKKVLRPSAETRLLEFLFKSLADTKKTRVKQFLKFRCVSVNGKISTQFDYPLKPGDEVCIVTDKDRPVTPASQFNLKIVFEDDVLLAIDKPAGLLTVGSEQVRQETAIFALNDYLNKKVMQEKGGRARYTKRIFVVHRIDRDVSGIVLFAKGEEIKLALQENWAYAEKEYFAVVEGEPKQKSGSLVSHLSENKFLRVYSGPQTPESKKAITHYEVLTSSFGYSLLRVRLETGRKHQIRVHLADMGHCIVGDTVYGARKGILNRIALHACRLAFEHPVTGEPINLSLEIPSLFKDILHNKF